MIYFDQRLFASALRGGRDPEIGFRMNLRLWMRRDLLQLLFANHEALDKDLKAERPLKPIWTAAAQDDPA